MQQLSEFVRLTDRGFRINLLFKARLEVITFRGHQVSDAPLLVAAVDVDDSKRGARLGLLNGTRFNSSAGRRTQDALEALFDRFDRVGQEVCLAQAF